MASLATDVKWGSSPTNYFNFSYSKQRSGTTQQYKITVECEPLTGASYFGFPIYVEITVNGKVAATKTLKSASPSQWSSALTYTTAWLDVANKTTGTTPLKIRVYSGSGSSRNTTYSYSMDIDPAASLVKATDANIESVSSVIFTRYNSAFTHTLAYKAEGQSAYTTIFTKQSGTSYAWTVPKSLYSLIPNDTEIEVTLRCQTYSGSTLMGTDTCTMTATAAKSKCAPAVSVTAVDNNANTIALTGSNKKIIKYHSDIAVEAEATQKNSAKISKVTLKCGSSTATGTSKTFTDAESVSVSATATDSRGYSTTANATGLSLIKYVKLTANTTAKRTNPTSDEITVTTKGNYFNDTFGAVNNTLTVQIAYKLQGAESFNSYADMTVEISGNTYTATTTLTGFDYTQNYDVRIRAQDQIYKYNGPLASAIYNNFVLRKGIPIFDWGENDFQFNVPVHLVANQYNKNNTCGLDAHNSDIVNLNGVYFRDDTDTEDEGIKFYRDGTNWDRLYASGGSIYFQPKCPENAIAYFLYRAGNKPYWEAGDSETVTNVFAGFVTGGRQTFYLNIPLTKPTAAGAVSVSGEVIGRGISGYVLDSYNKPINLAGGSGYTVTASKTISGIRVLISYDSEQTAGLTNNTPIAWYGTITVKFS